MNNTREWLIAAGMVTVAVLSAVAVVMLPPDKQSGQPVPDDPRGGHLTSYCLPDGSGMRAYERPFPHGGTQPLFSIVYTGDVPGPAHCEVAR